MQDACMQAGCMQEGSGSRWDAGGFRIQVGCRGGGEMREGCMRYAGGMPVVCGRSHVEDRHKGGEQLGCADNKGGITGQRSKPSAAEYELLRNCGM